MLVVDTIGHDTPEIAQAIETIQATFGQYGDAEALADAMRKKGVHIGPLFGHWPADTSWNSKSSGVAKRSMPELRTAEQDKATERLDYTGYPSINPWDRDYNKLLMRRSVRST